MIYFVYLLLGALVVGGGGLIWAARRWRRANNALEAAAAREQEQLERLAVLGRLQAAQAHEVGNLANLALSHMALLDEHVPASTSSRGSPARADSSPAWKQDRDALRVALTRMCELTTTTRSYLRGGRPEPQKGPLNQCIEEAMVLARPLLKNVDVTIDLAIDPTVKYDRIGILQVLVNLLKNASTALEAVDDPALRIYSRLEGGYVIVGVEDNGPGLAPPSAQPDGEHGLGLHIANRIVDAHGGRLMGLRRRHRGARFAIQLPATDEAPALHPGNRSRCLTPDSVRLTPPVLRRSDLLKGS